jgi:hypothetical protein
MSFEPDKITRQHILDAVNKIENDKIELKPSTGYDVIINDKQYPPKEVMRYAHEQMNGEKIWDLSGGEPTNKYLRNLGFNIQEKNSMKYTWVSAHLQIAKWIKDYEYRQSELVEILRKLGITPLNDKEDNNTIIPLEVMDPFTFMSYLNKYRDRKRLENLQKLCVLLNITPLPTDVDGIPTTNAQSVWLFSYKYERSSHDVPMLWTLFHALLNNSINDELFRNVLSIKGIANSKLTASLFIFSPYDYLPINAQTIPYLKTMYGVDCAFNTFSEYRDILKDIKIKTDVDFPSISHDAYIWNQNKQRPADTESMSQVESIKLNSINNIILYGPPGTGKTYHSIDQAVSIAAGSSSQSHAENKKVFDDLRKSGQIEFVTFHQNYSYEDFMVGLRPDIESEQLRFKQHKGIFYEIAKRARDNYNAATQNIGISKSFDDALTELLAPVIENDEPVYITMASGKSFEIFDVSKSSIYFNKPTGESQHTLSIETLRGIVEGSWEYKSGLGAYFIPLAKKIQEMMKAGGENRTTELQNYVIIIDEINRANISKVFGELITLLEPDKRLGAENELRITLPNGEKDFCLPPNLYIIGTMNTADKSIALIDIALRRRFEFIGMYPDYDVLEGGSKAVLEAINRSIYETKKSADFLIGHGYFMNGDNIEAVIQHKVIPLLMEYFSGKTDIVSDIFRESGYSVNYDSRTYRWIVTKNR